ncbi:GtrA family protein [Priestia megaterium]|uniref:GtrA family protein n=4 Tax=Priestia megaterium TaxID=1404 RepID=UPI000BFA6C6A|nr:GtrA family protein [Priestia megaterium]MDC7767376.1 GtrA family protein [Priestia megaterium]PEU69567.1 teichoic acid glycosylation protein [Priestia megaterium]PFQ86668.1 teichoic acid glycosylation protein [Priestia megaterium]PGR04919.1 teichoic acid glycosylation protein [Priestia megaterium]UYT83693.1 GtrA family protein [Priestia megaterium]
MKINKELFLYLFFGVLTTFINILIYTVLTKIFLFHYQTSTVLAWVISVLFAFITNKKYVFSSKSYTLSAVFREGLLFIIYRILSLGIDLLIMFIAIQILNMDDLVAKVIANILVIVVNYMVSKFHIFKTKEHG